MRFTPSNLLGGSAGLLSEVDSAPQLAQLCRGLAARNDILTGTIETAIQTLHPDGRSDGEQRAREAIRILQAVPAGLPRLALPPLGA